MRLDKYLCEAGLGTRSQVKKLLKSGVVTVNGQTTTWNCGITNTMTQIRYLQKQGESSVYLVSASSLNLFESTQQELGAVVSQ